MIEPGRRQAGSIGAVGVSVVLSINSFRNSPWSSRTIKDWATPVWFRSLVSTRPPRKRKALADLMVASGSFQSRRFRLIQAEKWCDNRPFCIRQVGFASWLIANILSPGGVPPGASIQASDTFLE